MQCFRSAMGSVLKPITAEDALRSARAYLAAERSFSQSVRSRLSPGAVTRLRPVLRRARLVVESVAADLEAEAQREADHAQPRLW